MADLGRIVARNIRGERSRLGLTQEEFGKLVGWSLSQARDAEKGNRRILVQEIPMICRALQVTFADLCRGAEPGDLDALGL
ncbi:transcriptional regulator with XRE-family HTH domain [Kineosporia succinea]|uniref:Transcriptional regulator with XRE-family HTH domain n=1 Tax=Kineosporia succinea TaxID=84632 RepID=A0ABT9NY52_9ACTN|nr:helix-turn-helix transcriptional regulator [Kineosporia succinea]MDP9825351.1 transcriptional regulator with XRE-family HTH domain [Kineosporia succinea]